MTKCVPESTGPTLVWIVTLLACVSKSPSQSSQGMRFPFSHFRTRLGGKGTYPDSGAEKLSGVHHFRQRGCAYASKLNSAQEQSQALECNCLYRDPRHAFGPYQPAPPNSSWAWSGVWTGMVPESFPAGTWRV